MEPKVRTVAVTNRSSNRWYKKHSSSSCLSKHSHWTAGLYVDNNKRIITVDTTTSDDADARMRLVERGDWCQKRSNGSVRYPFPTSLIDTEKTIWEEQSFASKERATICREPRRKSDFSKRTASKLFCEDFLFCHHNPPTTHNIPN